MTDAPQIPFSFFYKYFVNLKSFISFIVKQCIPFNNPQHFCASLSLPRTLSGQLLLLPLNYYFRYNTLYIIPQVLLLKFRQVASLTEILNSIKNNFPQHEKTQPISPFSFTSVELQQQNSLSPLFSLGQKSNPLKKKNQTKVSEFNISKNNLEGTFGVQERDVHFESFG